MDRKKKIYWYCQVIGWLFYITLNLIFFGLDYNTSFQDVLNYMIWFPIGIALTHIYRFFIIQYNILKKNLSLQILIIIFSSVLLSMLFFFLNVGVAYSLNLITYDINLIHSTATIINVTIVFVLWSLFYFGFHYINDYKRAEIQNLKWEATSKEIELNKLKSQLNPHFMFNSMNSIRALVDEDPAKAKVAITQLSNILRNTLMMNKNRLIPLAEELKIVKDYLELEHIRFEERLHYRFDTEPASLQSLVPPLLIQTLVENAIKHGISKLTKGGTISLHSKLDAGKLYIRILNSGQMSDEPPETGFGLVNTRQRLELLYSHDARIELRNMDAQHVLCELELPEKTTN